MYPVILNSENRELNYKSFYDKFLTICEEHKKQDRALIFAFILYDFTSPQISKVLQDNDYWLSLHGISGNLITIFSLHYKPTKPQKKKFIPAHINNLISIESSNEVGEGYKSLIKKYFQNGNNIKFPSVMFFQIDKDAVSDYILMELEEQKIESAFIELKHYIAKVVTVLNQITPNNKVNKNEIFNLVKDEIANLKYIKVFKRRLKRFSNIYDFAFSLFKIGS